MQVKIYFQCSSVPLWNWLPISVSRRCAILLHGYKGGQPSQHVHTLTVGRKGTNPSPGMWMQQHGWSVSTDSTVNGLCQQHEAGIASDISQTASFTVWSHFHCQGIKTCTAPEKKKGEEGEEQSDLYDGLYIHALPAFCIVFFLLIRLLVFGKRTTDLWCSTVDVLNGKPLLCYKAKEQLKWEVISYH